MSRLTNRFGLRTGPILERAIQKFDRHRSSGADFSATALPQPPRLRQLMSRHAKYITEDVTEKTWALFSLALHQMLDEVAGAHHVTEETLFGVLDGETLVCRLDHAIYEEGLLVDFKLTKAWSWVFGGRDEWTAQMNVTAEIMEQNGIPVKEILLCLFIRDWNRNQLKAKGPEDYPPADIQELAVELWPREQRQAYIRERIRQHREAEKLTDQTLPVCTEQERWADSSVWVVTKKSYKPLESGYRRAVKHGKKETQEEAEEMARALNEEKKTEEHIVEYKRGESRRCKTCSVWKFCLPGQEFVSEEERDAA